jgi:hypothetical protein
MNPGYRYELHRTNTREVDSNGKRFKWCVYSIVDVNGHKGISFWYFVTKQEALKSYPDAKSYPDDKAVI